MIAVCSRTIVRIILFFATPFLPSTKRKIRWTIYFTVALLRRPLAVRIDYLDVFIRNVLFVCVFFLFCSGVIFQDDKYRVFSFFNNKTRRITGSGGPTLDEIKPHHNNTLYHTSAVAILFTKVFLPLVSKKKFFFLLKNFVLTRYTFSRSFSLSNELGLPVEFFTPADF